MHNGVQKRVVTGLPSLADENTGDHALGPAHIVVTAKHATGIIGGGSHPEMRAKTGPAGALLGWMIKFDPWSGKVSPFVDLEQYEADNNPDKGEIDRTLRARQVHGGFWSRTPPPTRSSASTSTSTSRRGPCSRTSGTRTAVPAFRPGR